MRPLQDIALRAMSGPNSSIQSFDWSRDGARMAFVVVDAGSDAFVIENPLADAPATAVAARR